MKPTGVRHTEGYKWHFTNIHAFSYFTGLFLSNSIILKIYICAGIFEQHVNLGAISGFISPQQPFFLNKHSQQYSDLDLNSLKPIERILASFLPQTLEFPLKK